MPLCSKKVQLLGMHLMATLYKRLLRRKRDIPPQIMYKLHKFIGVLGRILSCIDKDPATNIQGLQMALRYTRKHRQVPGFDIFYGDGGWFIDQILDIQKHLIELRNFIIDVVDPEDVFYIPVSEVPIEE
jgi:hypothetical protein